MLRVAQCTSALGLANKILVQSFMTGIYPISSQLLPRISTQLKQYGIG
jgi:hypothetical protein